LDGVSLTKSCQLTIDDLTAERYIQSLTTNQINICKFLEEGYYQAFIAKRLKISRGYVNQTVKKLESLQLISPKKFTYHDTKTKRTKSVAIGDPFHGRATTYVVSDKLKLLISKYNPHKDGTYVLCSPHHKKLKYDIIDLKPDWNLNGWREGRAKSIYIRSWKPRGPTRHLWHVNTANGVIGIEAHPRSIVAYRVDKKHIIATTFEESEDLLTAYIQDGVQIWLDEQQKSGVVALLGSVRGITKPHYAFESEIAKEVIKSKGILTTEGLFVDNSPESRGDTKHSEIETTNPTVASLVDKGLRNAINIESIVEKKIDSAINNSIPALTQTIFSKVESLHDEISIISTQLEKNNELQSQFTTLIEVLKHTIDELSHIRDSVKTNDIDTPIQQMDSMYTNSDYDMMYQ